MGKCTELHKVTQLVDGILLLGTGFSGVSQRQQSERARQRDRDRQRERERETGRDSALRGEGGGWRGLWRARNPSYSFDYKIFLSHQMV